MSIKKVVKLLGNIGDVARKYGKVDNPLFRDMTMVLGEEIKERLVDGLYGSYDINGKQFKNLKTATIAKKKKMYNVRVPDWILVAKNKRIKNFVESDDLLTTGTLQVKLKSLSGEPEYLQAQNDGIPERNVPSRKWYGIPKTYQEGGTKYNKFLNKLVDAYNDIFNEAIKKG